MIFYFIQPKRKVHKHTKQWYFTLNISKNKLSSSICFKGIQEDVISLSVIPVSYFISLLILFSLLFKNMFYFLPAGEKKKKIFFDEVYISRFISVFKKKSS